MSKDWISCAQWPAGLLSFAYADHDNTTRDGHETKEQANAVCLALKKHGLGGERCHFPVAIWMEHPSEPNKRIPCHP